MLNQNDFLWAHDFCRKWEGGIDDDPDDPGGFTCYGVCMRFLIDFVLRRPQVAANLGIEEPISKESMKRVITPAVAAMVLKVEFWPRQDNIDRRYALFLYDSCMNCGLLTGVRFIQRAANACGHALKVDGVLGEKTAAALVNFDTELVRYALQNRRNYYEGIVSRKPAMKKFIRGWLNRLNALEKYLDLNGGQKK